MYPVLHCNLKCLNCSMASPYLKPEFESLEQFKKDCDALNKYYELDIARFTGGECTLHPEIVEFLKYPKEIGLAKMNCIITNGINLLSQPEEFWKNLDAINLSIYRDTNINYDKIIKKIEGYQKIYPKLQLRILTDMEVVKTLVGYQRDIVAKGSEVNIVNGHFKVMHHKDTLNTEEEALDIWKKCWLKDSAIAIYGGHFYRCPMTYVKAKLYEQSGIESPFDFSKDAIPLHQENTGELIKNMMESETNIQACRVCLGFNTGVDVPHRQMRPNEIKIKEIIYDHG